MGWYSFPEESSLYEGVLQVLICSRMAKKLELAYLWRVQASHLHAFGLSSISLPSNTHDGCIPTRVDTT
jgi:hypothetical protein